MNNIISLEDAIAGDYTIIDIRSNSELKSTGTLKGSHHIVFLDESGNYDLSDIIKSIKALDAKNEIVLMCKSGMRSKNLSQLLKDDIKTLSASEGMDYILANKKELIVK